MIQHLINRLKGRTYIDKKYYDDMMKARDSLIQENNRLRVELIGKEEKLKRLVVLIDMSSGDVEPTDEGQRRNYVAKASNFYSEILEKKLMQLIAQTREEMDSILNSVPYGMTRADYDNYLRGTSNAFKLLMDYYEMLKGEHLSNITKETE